MELGQLDSRRNGGHNYHLSDSISLSSRGYSGGTFVVFGSFLPLPGAQEVCTHPKSQDAKV